MSGHMQAGTMYAVEIDGLQKSFDGAPVLADLSLRVPEGCVYGLVGPAGSGKTTLIRTILGFVRRDAGLLRVLGTGDLEHVRERIGYLPQGQPYPGRFTPRELLRALAQFGGMRHPLREQRVGEALRSAGLSQATDTPIDTLTHAQRQRLGLAQALLAHPALLLLDEPTAGGDAPGDEGLLDLVASIRERGQSVLLVTQRIEDAEYLCDRVGVLAHGRVVAEAETRSLRGPGRNALISVTELPADLADRLRALSPAVLCEGAEIALRPNAPDLQARVLSELIAAGATVIAIEPFGRPIEEMYARALRGQPWEGPQPPDRADEPAPAAAPAHRPGHGDTLLRELLKSEDQRP
jgi:ABC-2 type transport system ATP-binding protein